jgi:transcriptional regulator with XRE-family HTH domain
MRQEFKTLGTYFQEKRSDKGLSQKDVADILGYSSAQFVSNWERGISAPPLEALPTLVKLYQIPTKEIVTLMLKEQEKVLLKVLSKSKKKSK